MEKNNKYNLFISLFICIMAIIYLLVINIAPKYLKKAPKDIIQSIEKEIYEPILPNQKNTNKIIWASIGDSITDYTTFGSNEKVYGNYIEEISNYKFINLGYGGSGVVAGYLDSKNYFNRVNQIPRNTQVVTIFGSFNDIFDSSGRELKIGNIDDRSSVTLYGQLNQLMDAIYDINKYMVVGIILPIQWGMSNSHLKSGLYDYADKYVQALKDYAEYNSIPYLDLYNDSGIRVWDDKIQEHYREDTMVHPDSFLQKIYLAPKIKYFLDYIGHAEVANEDNAYIKSDFQDSSENNIDNNINNAKIGDEVIFGKNEWIVLDKNEKEAFLFSKNVIDCEPYNKKRELVTWKDSSLRTYLNENLYNKLFSDKEKSKIIEKIYSHNDIVYMASPSDSKKSYKISTTDKMTLLSLEEYVMYSDVPNVKHTNVTRNAYNKLAYVDKNGNCIYWLRDNGVFFQNAMVVKTTSDVQTSGFYVDVLTYGIRPCVTVSISS